MAYVIAGILVVLIVTAAVAIGVRRATEGKGQAAVVAPDSATPLGDTDQHAGEQSRRGETVADPEARQGVDPSARRPRAAGGAGDGGVGGESEGGRPVETESERLADRSR